MLGLFTQIYRFEIYFLNKSFTRYFSESETLAEEYVFKIKMKPFSLFIETLYTISENAPLYLSIYLYLYII